MAVIFFFILAGQWFVLVGRGTFFDLFPGQIDEKHFPFGIKVAKSVRRNEDKAPGQPSTSVSDHVAHRPIILVIEIEIPHVPDFAVARAQFLALAFLNAV